MEPNERLASFRETTGLSQSKISLKLGFNRTFWGLVESGRTAVTENLVTALERRFRVNPQWVRDGSGVMLKGQDVGFEAGRKGVIISPPNYDRPSHGDFSADGEEYVFVRRFNIELSAGGGVIPSPQDDDESLAFTQAFMSKNRLNSDLCVLVRVKGESMGVTVPDGSLVLVHVAEMQVNREGIYAFNRDGAAFIKRLVPLEKREDGLVTKLLILGDGMTSTSETVSGVDLADIRVVGRVRAVLSTFD